MYDIYFSHVYCIYISHIYHINITYISHIWVCFAVWASRCYSIEHGHTRAAATSLHGTQPQPSLKTQISRKVCLCRYTTQQRDMAEFYEHLCPAYISTAGTCFFTPGRVCNALLCCLGYDQELVCPEEEEENGWRCFICHAHI
jgi:hypothetical protein